MRKEKLEELKSYLEELKIKDGKLSPKFDPMNNEYCIEVGLDVKKLEII